MLAEHIQTLTHRLESEAQLQRKHAEQKIMEDVLDSLKKVESTARSLMGKLAICTPYLDVTVAQELWAAVNSAGQNLDASLQRFAAEQRKEKASIDTIGKALDELESRLAKEWKKAAQKKVDPYRDLLLFKDFIPEIREHIHEITDILQSIEAHCSKPPQSSAALAQFHKHLSNLERLLDAVTQLPQDVRTFLIKILGETATVEDLTPQVRAWIDEGNRGSAFRISFTSS